MNNKCRTSFWIIGCLIIGILGGLIAIQLFGRPVYRIGPLKARISLTPSISGRTTVAVPPLGTMTAKTHNAPARLIASVEEMDVNAVRQMLVKRPKADDIFRQTQKEATLAFRSFALRIVFLALIGGAGAAFVALPRRRLLAALLGGVSGVVSVGIVMGAAVATFDASALAEPRYEGALRSAPWMVKLVRQGFFHLDNVDTELRAAAANVSRLEGQMSALAPVENGGPLTRILVVSDLHNNTVAMRIVSDLALAFDADMVLNAGDLTDFGTPFEQSMTAVMGEIPKPHVFVGGNHDSPQTFDILRRLRNTRLPDEGLVEVDGLTILGQSDPSARSKDALVTPRYELDRAKRKLLARYRKLKTPPDIILVHSPRIAKAFLGKAPIIVNGDDHRLHVDHVKGSAWIDPGTTGASGIRYFKNGSPKDVTAVVLYVSKTPNVHAIAADLISIQSPKGEFFVQRKRFSVEGNANPSALNNRNN